MKLANILREVTANRDREMVTGVAEILRDVKDESNREELATKMMHKFDQEGVQYDQLEFLKMANVNLHPINTVQATARHKVHADHTDVRRLAAERKRLKEIGFTKKKDFGFPYTRVTGTEDAAIFEFSSGENDYKVFVGRERGYFGGLILHIGFAVMDRGPVMFPGHKPDTSPSFEKEVNDPKNMYKVMNTVVNIAKEEMARLKQEGERVVRIKIEPAKRKDDPNDERRANLYMAYLKKEFPNAQIKSTANKSHIWVDML